MRAQAYTRLGRSNIHSPHMPLLPKGLFLKLPSPAFLQLAFELLPLFLELSGVYEIEIEKTFEHIESPLGLARFDLNNLTGFFALYRMSRKIAILPDSIDSLAQMCGQVSCVKNLLDFVGQVPQLNTGVLAHKVLQAAPTESSTGLCAPGQYKTCFVVILCKLLRCLLWGSRTRGTWWFHQTIVRDGC